jgi:hypothetical protein
MIKASNILTIAFTGIVLIPQIASTQSDTANYWKCNNRVGGQWAFGLAPSACDVSPFVDPQFIISELPVLVFDDNVARTPERQRYMQELYPVVREVARRYLLRRRPKAPLAEQRAWERAIFTVAHQESFWSHYRVAKDKRVKMMRGDYGHGHGMMQVDDRWHFVAISNGKGALLFENLLYAMDEFFSGWERAPRASCVQSSSDYKGITRSAYSAYNGGASKICRWTNPKDNWARNDINFLEKWNGLSWEGYVDDLKRDPAVDVGCHMEGQESCGASPQPGDRWLENVLYKLSASRYCHYQNYSLKCVTQYRDIFCLDIAPEVLELGTVAGDVLYKSDPLSVKILDRHELCAQKVLGLFTVGQSIVIGKNLNLRKTPAGEQVVVLASGTKAQIIDFEVKVGEDQKRYYRLKNQNHDGYVYAGNQFDFNTWADESPTAALYRTIAQKEDSIQIANSHGINLRDQVGGARLATIPKGDWVQVEEVVVRSDNNSVYYRVRYGGSSGFIYGGQILPENTTGNWVRIQVK